MSRYIILKELGLEILKIRWGIRAMWNLSGKLGKKRKRIDEEMLDRKSKYDKKRIIQ